MTVTKDSSGRYFLSFVVDPEPDILPGLETDAGLGLGLSAFAVLSDGSKIDSPRFLRRAEVRPGHKSRHSAVKQEAPRKGRTTQAGTPGLQAREHVKVEEGRIEATSRSVLLPPTRVRRDGR